ncbi:hypothetical protein HN865_01620 [Candidatus Woesearchaeota archaeon]|nr:hypothetical protein [Candidatus Woesearchaeota archaeon]MBT7237535.1 hypothetical protein [Candidatus Woesearchaeota archaeon]
MQTLRTTEELLLAGKINNQEALYKLNLVMRDFEASHRLRIVRVPNGYVQDLTSQGNYASIRLKPGLLQIENSVFDNPNMLLSELRHELGAFLIKKEFGGLSKTPMFKDSADRFYYSTGALDRYLWE